MKKIKFDTITFFNNFNNGDLHLARSLMRYVMGAFPRFKYRLRHPNHVKVLGDLKLPLSWKPVANQFDLRGYYVEYGSLQFNTQYLTYNHSFFRQYSSTIMTLWNIFNQTLKEVFDHEMPMNFTDFLPEIDYGFYNIKKINTFAHENKDKKLILVCNNEYKSEQSMPINFDVVLSLLSNTFKDVLFLPTNPTTAINDNIIPVSSILGQFDGCDLNEISYISTLSEVIIGRNSGPYTFSQVKLNLLDPSKTFISFSPPSSLYGSDPTKWVDFGVSSISTEHAAFINIPEKSDAIRNSKIIETLESVL